MDNPLNIAITLPLPPSVNRAYRNVVIKGHARTLLSKDGREYKQAVKTLLSRAKSFGDARLEVSYRYFFQSKRKADIGNREKLLSDALEGVLFDNDEQIDVLHQYRGGVDKEDPRVEVFIATVI